jgi:hypothetical protein
MKDSISCPFCNASLEVLAIHNGSNDSIHAYCDSSAHVTILNLYDMRLRTLLEQMNDNWNTDPAQLAVIENELKPCSCGGKFTFSAPLRCSKCNQILSSEIFGNLIDPEKKWWDRSWHSIYAFILDGLVVKDNWE